MNDVIKENTEVYVYLSRNKIDRLSIKWTGPVRIIKEKHSSYLTEYQKQGQMVTKWTTRENLRWTEQNQNDIYNKQSNTLILNYESPRYKSAPKIWQRIYTFSRYLSWAISSRELTK